MVRVFLIGLIAGVLLCGCAGFAFKYYGLDGIRYEEGKLLGPEPKFDRPFSDCAPTQKEKHPCVVMFTPEFKAFKTDYEGCKIELSDCQRRCGQ
jgi:hypothetical protein